MAMNTIAAYIGDYMGNVRYDIERYWGFELGLAYILKTQVFIHIL